MSNQVYNKYIIDLFPWSLKKSLIYWINFSEVLDIAIEDLSLVVKISGSMMLVIMFY